MSHSVICYKCKRSVIPVEIRKHDKKKVWLITVCPFERCKANLDIVPAPTVRVWNGSYFEEQTNGIKGFEDEL